MIPCEALMEYLAGVPFPASKEELVTFLQEQAAPPEAVWMVERMPGRDFRFAADVESTVRLAHELHLDEPLREEEEPSFLSRIESIPTEELGPGSENGPGDDELLAQEIRERLRRCRNTNPWLVRIHAAGGVVTLDGRVTDVPQGILVSRIAQGVPGVHWVINNLDVTT